MGTYRLKSYRVTAVQCPAQDSFPEHSEEFRQALADMTVRPIFIEKRLIYFEVNSRGRTSMARETDWLVFEQDGNVYVVNDENFRKKYEAISNDGTRIPPYTN